METQKSERVLFERDGKVGIIRLNRPRVLNCFDYETLTQLKAYLKEIEAEKKIRVILICGNGRAFSTGMDLKFAKGKDPETMKKFNHLGLVETLGYLQRFPKPTIAVVHGFALGGGFELALSCDFRFVSKKAIFGFPEIDLGILPTWGGLYRPTDLAGLSQAMELVLTAKRINAETALAMGLVNQVIPHDQLFDTALAFAKNLAQKDSRLLQFGKNVMRRSVRASPSERFRLLTLAAEFGIERGEQKARLQAILNEENHEEI